MEATDEDECVEKGEIVKSLDEFRHKLPEYPSIIIKQIQITIIITQYKHII